MTKHADVSLVRDDISEPTWCVILAGGNGRRLAAVTGGVPKQFWAPRGGRTLLEHTADRMASLAPPRRTITVVSSSQRRYADAIGQRTALGRLVYQIGDRGTAAGILRGLTEIEADGDAVVVLTPSDHGIARPGVFLQGIREAAREARSGRAGAIVLAVAPKSAACDFGWIVPDGDGATLGERFRRIERFVEKPPPALAATLFGAGAVWNTMVMVARLDALLDLYRTHLPVLADVFRRARQLPGHRRDEFLTNHYQELPHTDFSRDLLTPARGLQLYVWPESLGWADLGTPDRLDDWMKASSVPPAGRESGASRLEVVPYTHDTLLAL